MINLPVKTERLYIDKFDAGMAESVRINSLDDDNRRFTPDEVFETLNDANDILAYLIACYDKKDAPLVYPVFLNDGKHIGHVQAVPYGDGWEIGYHIAQAFTGNGYATEAARAFLPVVMAELGAARIYGVCRSDNFASRRVLEKCGFIFELETEEPEGVNKKRRYVYNMVID